MLRNLRVFKSWRSIWLITETIMPLTHKRNVQGRSTVILDQLVEGGQKLSLGVISGGEGAHHPSTLWFCCNFVKQPLLPVFLWKKQGGLRLIGCDTLHGGNYVCIVYFPMFFVCFVIYCE